ncbi:pilin [Candidatus Parcubacteria bacterium]|nr:pilin [Candidatus Parcubacteria bacterium]
MKKFLIVILSVFFVSSFLVCANVNQVLAYDLELNGGLMETGLGTGHFIPTGMDTTPLPERIGDIIGAILAFVGVIFLILMIYGGYTWMMARGNEEQTTKAKSIIRNALIGIVVVLAAYAITAFIGSELNPFSWLQNPNGGIIEQDLIE